MFVWFGELVFVELKEVIVGFGADLFVEFFHFLFDSIRMFGVKGGVFMVCLWLVLSKGLKYLIGFILKSPDGFLFILTVLLVMRIRIGPLFIHLAEINFTIKVESLVLFPVTKLWIFLLFTLIKVVIELLNE